MKMAMAAKPFNLFRWFSLVSLVIILVVAILLGSAATRFLMRESIDRDAMLSAQFIKSIADVEVIHGNFSPGLSLSEFLDKRVDGARLGVSHEQLVKSHEEFFDHIVRLPDVLLASVYAPDGMVIWSTRPELVGRHASSDSRLKEAIQTRSTVTVDRHGGERLVERYFLQAPKGLYLESFIPLQDSRGEVLSVIEIYKEPVDLIARMNRGLVLLWTATALGGAVIYLSLFWFVRHASRLVEDQQRKLVENETLALLGEMSTAVAHSLRNPLASIRSSAELALEVDPGPLHKNLGDIITQVDRMSKWVRELLMSARPLSGDQEPVDLTVALEETLAAYEPQIRHAGIEVDWQSRQAPKVVSHPVLLQQLLGSVLSNAIEAMPRGGRLAICLEPDARRRLLTLTVSDTGSGMSPAMLEMAFKPFHTTKRGGLGVGLVLVRKIIERFGGDVSIDSRENAGTNVHLTFRATAGG
ncbi:HAMP domain-containing sensor histidine kinase [Pseudomonas sp. BN515]|uniref:sensor histidine kinase n=1 Tax=Pseudomonas sp. BN515 TaxID=2567892 RepID=UPI0024560116|nr:HAMP domain-containing sensor histidine kinase [Pseudomonas sp. BN515]MDH4871297.1 HAMP domain-containing histidine kinase [Pseudomonas sp. BN515]